jgi:hypothetical protein
VRTAVKYVSALAVIGIVACSGSRSDDDLARAQNLRSELANNSVSTSPGVVSDIEVPPVASLAPARAGKTVDPKGGALGKPAKSGTSAVSQVSRDSGNASASVARPSETTALDTKVGEVTVTAPVLDVVAPSTAVIAVEPTPIALPAPRPHPMEPVSAGDGRGDRGPAAGGPMDERPPAGPRPDVIRGGPSRDPCAIHTPGAGSILINNRMPVINRGGIRFPGGIR